MRHYGSRCVSLAAKQLVGIGKILLLTFHAFRRLAESPSAAKRLLENPHPQPRLLVSQRPTLPRSPVVSLCRSCISSLTAVSSLVPTPDGRHWKRDGQPLLFHRALIPAN